MDSGHRRKTSGNGPTVRCGGRLMSEFQKRLKAIKLTNKDLAEVCHVLSMYQIHLKTKGKDQRVKQIEGLHDRFLLAMIDSKPAE